MFINKKSCKQWKSIRKTKLNIEKMFKKFLIKKTNIFFVRLLGKEITYTHKIK